MTSVRGGKKSQLDVCLREDGFLQQKNECVCEETQMGEEPLTDKRVGLLWNLTHWDSNTDLVIGDIKGLFFSSQMSNDSEVILKT